MKNIFLACAVVALAAFTLCAQTSNAETEKLKEINQQVVAKYKSGNFNDALKAAQESLDLTIKIYGSESNEAAISHTNIGEIYLAKKKYNDATVHFQKSLAIFQLNPKNNSDKIVDSLERLGIALTLDGKNEQGEEILLQIVKNVEITFGEDSKELLPYLKSLSELYIYAKKNDDAEKILLRRYSLASKYFEPESKELEKLSDDFYCFTSRNYKSDEAAAKQMAFYKATRKEKNEDLKNKDANTINGGVVNGKAKSLAIPEYPANARARRAEGTVTVKVTIDEQGKVVDTKVLCGDAELGKAGEEAARRSTFSQTQLDGKPVRVTGIIIYNFTR